MPISSSYPFPLSWMPRSKLLRKTTSLPTHPRCKVSASAFLQGRLFLEISLVNPSSLHCTHSEYTNSETMRTHNQGVNSVKGGCQMKKIIPSNTAPTVKRCYDQNHGEKLASSINYSLGLLAKITFQIFLQHPNLVFFLTVLMRRCYNWHGSFYVLSVITLTCLTLSLLSAHVCECASSCFACSFGLHLFWDFTCIPCSTFISAICEFFFNKSHLALSQWFPKWEARPLWGS